MKLNTKRKKINKLRNMNVLVEIQLFFQYKCKDNKISFAVFELKEAIKRLNDYIYYSNKNPFHRNVSYINYSRFIYESYLNDTYIIQTRFRTLINSIKESEKLGLDYGKKQKLEEEYKNVVKGLQIITKDIRGEHVHRKRYNDIDYMICDLMERNNRIFKKICNRPILVYKGKDVYLETTKLHLNDVQDMIIDNNNYLYIIIDPFIDFLKSNLINR